MNAPALPTSPHRHRTGARRASTRPAWIALMCSSLLAAAPVWAHDTWFLALPPAPGSTVARLALGTGDPFPVHTTPLWRTGVARQGCARAAPAGPAAMRPFQLPAAAAAQGWQAPPGALHCWAQSLDFELTLPADKAAAYLDEVRAGPALRASWARLQAEGEPWQERYSKHARILLPPPGAAPDASTQGGTPASLGLDIRLHNAAPLRRHQTLQAQVVRDGLPLAGLSVELRHDQARFSQWAVSDAQGRLALTPPLAGTWVLRAIDLRPPGPGQTRWDSRFVSLVFDVAP
ncbi:MAG: DUF4198 domain-containing protein [Rubrivivax sp.]